MLSRHDVWRALEELGIHVGGWEADALLDRFTLEDGDENRVRECKVRKSTQPQPVELRPLHCTRQLNVCRRAMAWEGNTAKNN